MNTKEHIALLLERSKNEYISGKALSEEVGLTRAAVWKCIKSLEEDGYDIETSRQGYRLGPNSDAVSLNSIRTYLTDGSFDPDLEIFQTIDSTNNYLKNNVSSDYNEWHTVISSYQSAGRGRRGRTFVSPAKTGVYISVLLRPDFSTTVATKITTAAAVAACRAIEGNTDRTPSIKWVNDIFVNEKKVCGILTEASVDLESGNPEWVIMGIGFNVYEPDGGFPKELKDIAGAISPIRERDLRSRIAASFLMHFHDICSDLATSGYADEYRARSFLIGKDINVISGDTVTSAHVLDIDEECRLVVRYEDGNEESLSSGEVSVKEKK